MFVRKSTYQAIVVALSNAEAEIAALRDQLAQRQVPAVRGQRGRFVKRGQAA